MTKIITSRTGKPVKTIMSWGSWADGQKWIDRVMAAGPDVPWSRVPTSSVGEGMATCTVKEAIALVEPENAEEIMARFKARMKLTPYTNWSGD